MGHSFIQKSNFAMWDIPLFKSRVLQCGTFLYSKVEFCNMGHSLIQKSNFGNLLINIENFKDLEISCFKSLEFIGFLATFLGMSELIFEI